MNARRILALGIAAALGASAALAQVASQAADPRDVSATQDEPRTETRSVATGGGRVVFIDPATGKIRQPDAAEIGRLVSPAPARARVRPPLPALTGPGGAVGVLLDSRFDSLMIATKKPDGTLTMDCVTGDDAAAEALSSGAKAASTAGAHGTLDVQ